MAKVIPERKVSKNSKTRRVNKFDDGQVMERYIEESPLSKLEVTKFKCKHCDLTFGAKNIAEVVRCGKVCGPCKRIVGSPGYRKEDAPSKIEVPKFKRTQHYTCKRCGATYIENNTKCVLCDCIEFLDKL